MNKKIFLLCGVFLHTVSLAQKCHSNPNKALAKGWTAIDSQRITFEEGYKVSNVSISSLPHNDNTKLVICTYVNRIIGDQVIEDINLSKKIKGTSIVTFDNSRRGLTWTSLAGTYQCPGDCIFQIGDNLSDDDTE